MALTSSKAVAPDSRWALSLSLSLSRAKFSSYAQRQYVWRLADHLAKLPLFSFFFFFYVDLRGNGDSYCPRRIARDIFNVSGIHRLLGAKEHNSITRSDERLIGLESSPRSPTCKTGRSSDEKVHIVVLVVPAIVLMAMG